ncbi:MAG: DNA-binding transcriptional ArsR family regulator [Candidatus Nitrosomirales archaeon]|jgi:DNA-binding transcriptional ArsR family regulator
MALARKIGETKEVILESCINPKSWSELIQITSKSEPTLMVHLKDLQDLKLIGKREDGLYETTEDGLEILKLVPSVRPINSKDYPRVERWNTILFGLGKDLNLTEKIATWFPSLVARGYGHKEYSAFAKAIAEALRSSVVLWSPAAVEIDFDIFRQINRIAGEIIENRKAVTAKGKVRLIIDVDFPRALDMRIREEKDPKIKAELLKNRDRIIDDVIKRWHKLFE